MVHLRPPSASRGYWLPVCRRPDRWIVPLLMGAGLQVFAGEQVLVMGDSLTKEHQSEFPVLYPEYPAAWSARNWIELLHERRHQAFDLGSWSVFTDLRLTGHEFNWAKPGGTAREFRNFLRQTADAQSEITASDGGGAVWAMFPVWRTTFTASTSQVSKVVIFLGGNDLALGNTDPAANPVVDGQPKQMDYESVYAGTFGAASNPDHLRASIRSNLKSVIEWFRNPRTGSQGQVLPPRFTGPMILCAVPHVGCTPKVQAEAGTDPARTAVLTGMIEVLNGELRDFAASKDVGFADVYAVTKRILDPAPFEIGGLTFHKTADNDCRPRYLFSGDGFHPNTPVHAKVAQVVTDAFLEKYPWMAKDLVRLGDREILTGVLGLPGDLGYAEWMTEAGIPLDQRGPLSDPDKDDIPNVMEYALAGLHPGAKDRQALFAMEREPLTPGEGHGEGEVLTITWQPRFAENAYCDLVPWTATGLQDWTPSPPQQILRLQDGRRQIRQEVAAGQSWFFRLAAVRNL